MRTNRNRQAILGRTRIALLLVISLHHSSLRTWLLHEANLALGAAARGRVLGEAGTRLVIGRAAHETVSQQQGES